MTALAGRRRERAAKTRRSPTLQLTDTTRYTAAASGANAAITTVMYGSTLVRNPATPPVPDAAVTDLAAGFTAPALAVAALAAALGIGALGRRGRHDVATALALVVMLALGSFFLSRTTEYEPKLYSLLFGEVLGVSSSQLLPLAGLALACVVAIALLYRPLLLSSVVPEIGNARGVRPARVESAFLVVLALGTALTVPVVGALLIFSLMIGPPAAARALTSRPLAAIGLSVSFALVTVWCAIALSYLTNWPIGFFVGTLAAVCFGLGRLVAAAFARRAHSGAGTLVA